MISLKSNCKQGFYEGINQSSGGFQHLAMIITVEGSGYEKSEAISGVNYYHVDKRWQCDMRI